MRQKQKQAHQVQLFESNVIILINTSCAVSTSGTLESGGEVVLSYTNDTWRLTGSLNSLFCLLVSDIALARSTFESCNDAYKSAHHLSCLLSSSPEYLVKQRSKKVHLSTHSSRLMRRRANSIMSI